MNDGYSKAKSVADKLKAETQEVQAQEEKALEAAKTQLAALHDNSELAKMYADNAQVGAENLAGELPLLKVHATGRSSNELADGSEPTDGNFFYKPTKEQFGSITCHILTISKGFRALGIAQDDGQAKEVFNQILGGVIVDNGEYKPFIMYVTGLKLQNMWKFGKEASKYTHAKPVPIPMFALTVRLSTEKVQNKFGKSWIVNFEIVRSEDNYPKLVMDAGEFQFLKDSVETVEDTISSLISSKTTVNSDDTVLNGAAVPSEAVPRYDENGMPF